MKSEFDYGEVIDHIDMVNSYGANNRVPHDPMVDNRVGIGMPVPSPMGQATDPATARKMTNLKIAVIVIIVALIAYLAYKRGKGGGTKMNPGLETYDEPECPPPSENETEDDEDEPEEDDEDAE